MNEEKLRQRYQRDGGPLGKNHRAMDRFINMLYTHKNCNDNNVRTIAENIENLETIAPNFTIFEDDKRTFYMHQFRALQINPNENDLVLSHEFGHAIISMARKLQISEKYKGLSIPTEIEVPENFEQIAKSARANCLAPRK